MQGIGIVHSIDGFLGSIGPCDDVVSHNLSVYSFDCPVISTVTSPVKASLPVVLKGSDHISC